MLQKRELTGLAKQFHDVAEELRRNGWCQRISGNSKGEHCILGAAAEALVDYTSFWGGSFEREFLRSTGMPPALWNDQPGRTKQEVIDKLEEIAWRLADEID